MRFRHTIIFLCLFFFSSVLLHAGQFAFKHFDEGVSPNVGAVHGIMQDSENIIWVWGDNGVFSYDGDQFHHFSEDEGLLDKYCYEVYEAENGEIVICTYGGINRYNKKSGEIANVISIRTTPVRDIVFVDTGAFLALDHGVFWLEGDQGVYIPNYDYRTHKHKNWMASKLLYDESKRILWVVSDRAGVYKYHVDKLKKLIEFKNNNMPAGHYNGDPFLFGPNYTEGVVLDQDAFVIADSVERDELWQSAIELVDSEESIGYWHVKDILMTNNEEIYGWGFGKIYHYKGESFIDVSKAMGVKNKKVNHVTVDQEGNFIISCIDGVVYKKAEEFLFFNRRTGLNENNVIVTLCDNSGYFWFVDENSKVSRLINTNVKLFTSDHYPFLSGITRAITLPDGSILLGGENGISRYKNGQLEFINKLGDLGDEFREFAVDKNNNILIATLTQLYHFNIEDNRLRPLTPKLTHHYGAYDFSKDPEGNIWTALYGNLYVWDGNELAQIPAYKGALTHPTNILAAYDGSIFIGQWVGLERFKKNERWFYILGTYSYTNQFGTTLEYPDFEDTEWDIKVDIPIDDFLDTPSVMCGDLGPDGVYWFGTFSAGLLRMDINQPDKVGSGDIQVFDSRNGLPDDHVLSVYKDKSGDLYFVLDNGACKVTKNGLEILHHQIPENALVNQIYQDEKNRTLYATSSGVFILDKNRKYMFDKGFGLKESHAKQLITTSDGKTLAVQPNGFMVFSIDELLTSVSSIATPVIKAIWSEDNRLPLGNDIELNSKRRSCRIEFALPDYFNENQNYFSWKLEGFDPDFSAFSRSAYANYTNLPKGKYYFYLRTKNGYGEISEIKYPFEIQVPPRFYETVYFYLLISTVIILIFLAIYFRQTLKFKREREQQLKIEAEKLESVSKLASAVAHEFNNPLAIIKGSVEITRLAPKDVSEELLKRDKVILKQVARMSTLVVRLLNIKAIKTLEYTEGRHILDIKESSSQDEIQDTEQ